MGGKYCEIYDAVLDLYSDFGKGLRIGAVMRRAFDSHPLATAYLPCSGSGPQMRGIGRVSDRTLQERIACNICIKTHCVRHFASKDA